ncbi:MAG: hypothetical protein CME70_13045 [Halobacteriovorax sp.]|nr:hypothetical protein [Halobacteriovorax sp.]
MNTKKFYIRLTIWGLSLLGLSFASFHINTNFEDREGQLIESLDMIRSIQNKIIAYELNVKDGVESEIEIKTLKSFQEKIPSLKKKLMKESFGQKYFNESRDLNISYQQYLFQIEESEENSTIVVRKVKRELEEIEKDLYLEVKKISMEKILWGAGGDFFLVLLSLLGGIAIVVLLKEDFAKLFHSNQNLLAKLEASRNGEASGDWSLDLENLNIYLEKETIDVLNLNLFETDLSFKNFLDYFTDESAKELREQTQLCSKEGDRFSVEVQKREMNDEKSWVNISGSVILGPEGKKVVGTISDIDEYRQAENRFQKLFNHISQPAFISGENGLWDCNNAALRFFKLRNKEDFLDKKLAELFPLNQADGKGSLKHLKFHMRKSQQEEHHRFGWTFRHKKGETMAEVQLFPIIINGNSLYLHVLKKDSGHISVVKDRQFRVIICDTNIHSRGILQGYFEEEDWMVKTTDNMADALALKEEYFFDMIVVDFSTNNLNLELFRLNQNKTHIVGISSGKDDSLHKDHVDSLISKPIMKEVVLGLIHRTSERTEKLVVDDVLDLYSGKFDVLTSYCNELEIYLEEFNVQFLKNLDFDEWDIMRENLLTLQTVSKKFSCRGLNQLFERTFKTLNERDNSQVRDSHKVLVASFRELIRNIRTKLGDRAA